MTSRTKMLLHISDALLDRCLLFVDKGDLVRLARVRSHHLLNAVARRLTHLFSLDTRQLDAVLRFAMGESFFLTGGAGTGKSHVIHAMYLLGKAAFNVVVTASTSSAANQLSSLNAMTLHGFLGATETIDRFGKKHFVPRTPAVVPSVVIVDEISMVTSDLFDALVDSTASQIIAVGDLLQLAPVKGSWVFESRHFQSLTTVNLVTNNRAAGTGPVETEFREILNRLRVGSATHADVEWLYENSRKEAAVEHALYSKNYRCDKLNAQRFSELDTPVTTVEATDELETHTWAWRDTELVSVLYQKDDLALALGLVGESNATAARGGMRAPPLTVQERDALTPPAVPESMELRSGVRVVLTRAIWHNEGNEEEGFVRTLVAANGEVGSLLDLTDEFARVELPPLAGTAPRIVHVPKVKSKKGGCVCPVTLLQRVWVRKQFPLAVGYARTFHKAQGMSLAQPTFMDVSDVYFPSGDGRRAVPFGIIYVAISRARHIGQIRFARRTGPIFNVSEARPDPAAFAYHQSVAAAYQPLRASVLAMGEDDESRAANSAAVLRRP